MKKILFSIFIWSFMCINVYANNHNVQAKYEKNYNVDLTTINITKGSKILNLDEYTLEFSTELTDIDIVLIKVGKEENNYIQQFTKIDNNYYLGFFKNNKKIDNSDIIIRIKNNNKILNIYDNLGNVINCSNEKIRLNNNNYFINIVDKVENNNIEYKTLNVDSLVNELEKIDDKSTISIYNYQNDLINNNAPLGTGYTIYINNTGTINQYKIIVKGDTTGDAKINLNDITRLYHYYKKIEKMDEPFVLAGDVANNNIINLNDITKIYHFYKNIISTL